MTTLRELLHGAVVFMGIGLGMLLFGLWTKDTFGVSTIIGGVLYGVGTYLLCKYMHEKEKKEEEEYVI